jgi:hypothetical protein
VGDVGFTAALSEHPRPAVNTRVWDDPFFDDDRRNGKGRVMVPRRDVELGKGIVLLGAPNRSDRSCNLNLQAELKVIRA